MGVPLKLPKLGQTKHRQAQVTLGMYSCHRQAAKQVELCCEIQNSCPNWSSGQEDKMLSQQRESHLKHG
jgi:hypothetical protein